MGSGALNRKQIHFVKSEQWLIVVVLILLLSTSIHAEQAKGQDWREIAQKEKLKQAAIDKLSENNFVITDNAYKQIFTPYIEGRGLDGGIPLFITTDSLINAYHVLYEESIFRLENANANKLEEILKFVLANLPKAVDDIKGKPELVAAARRRATIVVGTAMRLLDEEYKLDDSNVEKIVAEEVEKIKQAKAKEKPSWLGEPKSDLIGIDYSRYKPRSFYISSEQLSKYFRTVSWLQSIPFRLSEDDELLSVLILGSCLAPSQFAGDANKQQEYTDFFSTFKMLVGSGDEWDVITAKDLIKSGPSPNLSDNDLYRIRQKLVEKLKSEGGSQINDQVRFPPLDPNTASAEPQFRFISAYRTPDAILFHRTTDLREFNRSFPNGLEVCAALGSDFARSKLDYSDKAKLLKTIDYTKSAFSGDSLYLDYMRCLSCLLDEQPANRPDFMKKSAWQAKSCNTTLAGWSQLRHTWSLQAKQTAMYGGISFVPAGFVEPEPEFYSHMALLAQRSRDVLEKAGAFETDYGEISHVILGFIQRVESGGPDPLLPRLMEAMPPNERNDMHFVRNLMSSLGIGPLWSLESNYSAEDLAKLRQVAEDLQRGKLPENEDSARQIQERYFDLNSLWKKLESVSSGLVKVSEQQLEGQDLKEYDNFIKGYGFEIAKIMLYGGNSYLTPDDDSTRIVDVYYNPFLPSESYLHAGIGRARAIYVLYPWQGRLVLCRGPVMPYYEFTGNSRLTDAEWKNILDSPQRPGVPEWIKPVLSENNLSKPSFNR